VIKPFLVLLCLLLKTTAFGADPAITHAVERSILLMEKSIAAYVEARDCFTCHHQALPIMTLSQARRSGFSVAQKTFTTQTRFTLEYFSDRQDRLPKGEGVPGGPYTAGYALAQLQATQEPANPTSKALINYLLKTQEPDGRWRIRTHRPPLEDSHFTATALGIKAMINSEPAKKAAQWIAQAQPKTTEDHVFKVLGLHWADRQKESQAAAKVLLKLQDEEGGWAQLTTMKSDAYATGQALTALNKCGLLKSGSPQFKKGIQWLLKNQKPDGSWHVKTRSRPIQKYFESGFPHGQDQFISISATCWAVLALTGNWKP